MAKAPIDPETQLARFTQAIQLLGGRRAAAQILDVNERTIRKLIAGDIPLHDGWLRDIATALLVHADHCRDLEREISPAFAGNLTEQQAAQQGKPDARRFDQERN